MRVSLQQRGGYAGVPMRREIDTASMSEEDASQVTSLVERADFFSLSEPPPRPMRGADMYSYELTVEAGERKRTVRLQDGAVPPPLLPLLDRMKKVPPQAAS